MTDKEILAKIRDMVTEEAGNAPKPLQMVGTLTQQQGIRGYLPCPVGHPVFIRGDRYVLHMQTIDRKTTVEVPYYPESLKKAMDMNPVYNPPTATT